MKKFSNKIFEKCIDYYNCCKDSGKITDLVNGLMKKYPEELYEQRSLYTLLFFSFVFTDGLANRFFKDSINEYDREDAIKILKYNIVIKNKVEEMQNVVNEIKQELADLQIEDGYMDDFDLENPFIQNEYLSLVTFLLIQDELINKQVSIWEKEYDSNFDLERFYTVDSLSWKRNYINESVSKGIISYGDSRGILALSYFLVKKDFSVDFYKKWTDVFVNLREIQHTVSSFTMRKVICNI